MITFSTTFTLGSFLLGSNKILLGEVEGWVELRETHQALGQIWWVSFLDPPYELLGEALYG
jgi:hypothetical protein